MSPADALTGKGHVRYSPAFSTGLADPQEVDQRSPTSSCAQNSQICTALVFIGIEPAAAQNGGSRVGCHCESATLCNQHQVRMSKQADAPVSMRSCLAGQGRAGARGSPNPAHQGLGGHEVPHRGGTCGDERAGRGGDGGAEAVGDDRITLVPGAVEGSKMRCPQT